jgi:chromosome segregation ATPase
MSKNGGHSVQQQAVGTVSDTNFSPPVYHNMTAVNQNAGTGSFSTMQGAFGGQPGPMFLPMSQQPAMPSASACPPVWAANLIESVNQIKVQLQKLNSIEHTVNCVSAKLSSLETRVGDIEDRVITVEASCQFISDGYDQSIKDISESRKHVDDLQASCNSLEVQIKQVQTDKKKLESKMIDLESRSMRENLIFFGIKEDEKEDCTAVIRTFCQDMLEMENTASIVIDRAHRIGKNQFGTVITPRTRPIVVKFHRYGEREQVRERGYQHRDKLKNGNFGVREQYPKEVAETRKKLYPIMDIERRKNNTVKLVRDKLYINVQEYILRD